MAEPVSVRRLDLGFFVRPAEEAGTEHPRVEPVLAYLVRTGSGLVLFDTGVGAADPETEAHYRPRRRPLGAALADVGVTTDEISLVVNCHLHFDHCGGNPSFVRTPIVVQTTELAAARGEAYTFPELVDFPGARYEELSGEAEIQPGLWIVPTPGHTAGHQSLVVRRPDGTVILAGQAHDLASGFGGDHLALRATEAGTEPPLPPHAPWLARLLSFDPRRVLFAHDCSVWEPPDRP